MTDKIKGNWRKNYWQPITRKKLPTQREEIEEKVTVELMYHSWKLEGRDEKHKNLFLIRGKAKRMNFGKKEMGNLFLPFPPNLTWTLEEDFSWDKEKADRNRLVWLSKASKWKQPVAEEKKV